MFESLKGSSLEWRTVPLDESPAITLFKEITAIEHSIGFWKDSVLNSSADEQQRESAMQSILVSSFAFLMGHFETYQKEQIAVLINHKDFYSFGDDISISKKFEKLGCNITIQNIMSEVTDLREPGHIIADCLPGWHDPEKVNQYFTPLIKNFNFYSSSDIEDLRFLWQLRHSIVHSAGVVTRVDSIKSPRLQAFRGKKLSFEENFITELVDCLYGILSDALERLNVELTRLYSWEEDDDIDVDFINISTQYPVRNKKEPNKQFKSDS